MQATGVGLYITSTFKKFKISTRVGTKVKKALKQAARGSSVQY